MRAIKLGTCLAATAIIGAASTALARSSENANPVACSSTDRSYADGYANGNCTSNGGSGGTVTSCTDNGNGTITFSWYCY